MKNMKKIILILSLLFITNLNAETVGDATIEIQTSEGTITLQLDGRRAPITVKNFIQLIKNEWLNNEFRISEEVILKIIKDQDD